jgi:small subunit ribosomal protein S16
MLKIRLSRLGKKRAPTYRIVVTEADHRRDGRYVERIGWYNPLTNPESYRIDEARALYWLSVGAQPTDAMKRLLKTQGTYDRLARLHKGESFDALVAEYTGVPVSAPVVEEVAEEAAPKAETLLEKIEHAAEAVAEKVSEAVHAVEDAVVHAVEHVQEAVAGSAPEADEAEADEAKKDEPTAA